MAAVTRSCVSSLPAPTRSGSSMTRARPSKNRRTAAPSSRVACPACSTVGRSSTGIRGPFDAPISPSASASAPLAPATLGLHSRSRRLISSRSPSRQPSWFVASSSRWCASSTMSTSYSGRTRLRLARSDSNRAWLAMTTWLSSAARLARARKQTPMRWYAQRSGVHASVTALSRPQASSSAGARCSSARSPVLVCGSQNRVFKSSMRSAEVKSPACSSICQRRKHR